MKAVRHTGIVVKNLNKMLYFYRDLLGLTIVKDIDESGEFIDDILGLKKISVRTIKIKAKDENLVELLYFKSSPKKLENKKAKKITNPGYTHISFTVENIDKIYNKLRDNKIKFISSPKISKDGNVKVVFCQDPEGNFIELVEEIIEGDGKNNEKRDYLSVVYDENKKPKTDYPFKMASYIAKRFNFKRGQKLLEIGCGRGEFLLGFQRLGLNCSGCDLNKTIIENLKIKRVDVSKEKLPYDDNSFDIVYHKSLIEHLYSPENLMKETYRILKPGGIVIILTPDWVSQMKVFYEDFTHSRPYDKTSLHDVLEIFGFKRAKTELFRQLPVLWKYPFLKFFSKFLSLIISTPLARKLTDLTKIKFIRWSVELMVFGYGLKPKLEI